MKQRMSIRLSSELMLDVERLAVRQKISQSSIVEAAVASFLSPDGTDRREAAFTRRLDRLSRQIERLERNTSISLETLALFIRFYLTVTPPLPVEAQAAGRAAGQQRYTQFLEALGRRLQKGLTMLKEIPEDIDDDTGQKRQYTTNSDN